MRGTALLLMKPGLLLEKGIKEQGIERFDWNELPVFFKTNGDIPFDLFVASFYLLSRYEEHLPHEKDMYGRYAHGNSLAYKEGFLNKPIINYWLLEFGRILEQKFTSFTIHHSPFTYLPTYDIDEAFSFKHKEWWRSAGAAVKDIVQGKWKRFANKSSNR